MLIITQIDGILRLSCFDIQALLSRLLIFSPVTYARDASWLKHEHSRILDVNPRLMHAHAMKDRPYLAGFFPQARRDLHHFLAHDTEPSTFALVDICDAGDILNACDSSAVQCFPRHQANLVTTCPEQCSRCLSTI
ncbi:hypothetical protein Hypma_014254 [Hypsizygus marmoreus]|uniref:Uncharacterized protein n=1 Tax=Hypsizygus marmoreus TaxID=39966 RepID=A0A369JI94_HYPMA|nr:hypothetical protein Hypma_014254 [Hypsizygus marmoreus]